MKRSGGDLRGSSRDRRTRKQWVLEMYGDGVHAMCAFGCGTVLDMSTVTMDRYPVPGCMGGRYVRGNIRPACSSCNSKYGAPLSRKKDAVGKYYTAGQVAELLGVSPKTVARWANEGKLTFIFTLGMHRRFPVAEVDALVARTNFVDVLERLNA